MKKSTTFTNLFQTLLNEEDVKLILENLDYKDTATKFTAHQFQLSFLKTIRRRRSEMVSIVCCSKVPHLDILLLVLGMNILLKQ